MVASLTILVTIPSLASRVLDIPVSESLHTSTPYGNMRSVLVLMMQNDGQLIEINRLAATDHILHWSGLETLRRDLLHLALTYYFRYLVGP